MGIAVFLGVGGLLGVRWMSSAVHGLCIYILFTKYGSLMRDEEKWILVNV